MSTCSLCHGPHDEFEPCPPVPREAPRVGYMTLLAKYPGTCTACDERINEGDLIRLSEFGAVHADCT